MISSAAPKSPTLRREKRYNRGNQEGHHHSSEPQGDRCKRTGQFTDLKRASRPDTVRGQAKGKADRPGIPDPEYPE